MKNIIVQLAYICLAGLATLFWPSDFSYAANPDTKAALSILKSLNQHASNIHSIASSMDSDSRETVHDLVSETYEFLGEFGFLMDLEYLREKMIDSKDRAFVQATLKERIDATGCKDSITHTNKLVGMLRSPTLLSEAQYIRDDKIKICDLVQSWK
jgi:hypothetical protein